MQIVKATIHRNMSDDEYFKLTDHVGSSELKDYIASPYGHKLRYIDKEASCQFNGNSGTDLGTAFDDLVCAWLGGNKVIDIREFVGYEPYPPEWLTASGSLSTKGMVKAAVKEAEAEGRRFKTPDKVDEDATKLKLMWQSFISNPEIKDALETVTSTQLVMTCETSGGLKLRGKLDLETDRGGMDLKTGYVHPDQFVSYAIKRGWHIQSTYYSWQYDEASKGVGNEYSFLYQQNTWPYESAKIVLPFDVLRLAQRDMLTGISGLERGDRAHKHVKTFRPECPAWVHYLINEEQ